MGTMQIKKGKHLDVAVAKFSRGIDGAGVNVHELEMIEFFGTFLGFGLGLFYND